MSDSTHPLFVIIVTYTKPLLEVDRHVEEHRHFLQKGYDAGILLLSGRQEPRTGGIILARAADRSEIESFIEQDPFYREGLADYTIIQWRPYMAAEGLEHLK